MNKKATGIAKINRVFVNRSLNMENIRLVGFDMDHTLAPYKRETFEALAFRETLNKFIEAGYPEELSDLTFKPNFLIRGLMIDKERGNLLKVDGHKYVKVAYHGYRCLTKEERYQLYNKHSFKAEAFASVDTFFSLSEVQLFVEIVDYMANHPGRIQKSYTEIYQDIKYFIDLSHRDGTIKSKVLASLETYIIKDKFLGTTLVRLLNADKSIFLLTNSMFDYTNEIMNYVLDQAHEDFSNWRDYWDIVIVGAAKPGFFFGSQPFYKVLEDSNLLKPHTGTLNPSEIYHGGNAKLFEKLTGYRGDEILYVGDHIYGDIIQSKGSLNWRTMLVIEELEDELAKGEKTKKLLTDIFDKLEEREELDEDMQRLRSKIAANNRHEIKAQQRKDEKKAFHLLQENEKFIKSLDEKKHELKSLDHSIKTLIQDRDNQFHPLWGELMKVGLERSRFANQVSAYACIYTSKVSNWRFYSPFKKFISFHETLPHEG